MQKFFSLTASRRRRRKHAGFAYAYGSPLNDLCQLTYAPVLISTAKLNVRQYDILFVATQKTVEREVVLVDRLTELDLEISTASTFDLISLNVLSLPLVDSESAAAFLSSGEILTHAE